MPVQVIRFALVTLAALVSGDLSAEVIDNRIIDLPGFPVQSDVTPQTAVWDSVADAAAFLSTSGSLTEGLRNLPGISIQSGFGEIDPPRMSVRGSGLQSAPVSRGVWIEVDGYPINSADGSFNFSLVESMWISSARLSPGGWAGVPAMGGRLDLGYPAVEEETDSMASFGFGSAGWRSIGMMQSSMLDGSAVSASAAYVGQDGWRHRSAQRGHSVMVTTIFPQVFGSNQLQLRSYASRIAFDVPGPLTLAQSRDNPGSNSPRVEQDRPRRESEHLQIAGRLSSGKGHLVWEAQGSLVYSDDFFRQLLPNGISSQRGLDSHIRFRWVHDWQNSSEMTSEWELHLQSGDHLARRFRNAAGEKAAMIGDNRLRADTCWLKWNQKAEFFGGLVGDFSLAAVQAKRRIGERFTGRPSTALDLRKTSLHPRFALVLQSTDQLDLWIAGSRVYEPPVFSDLIHTTGPMHSRELAVRQLDWQRSDSCELGLNFNGSRLQGQLVLYSANWSNELLNLIDENGSARGTVNADRTRHRGLYASLAALITKLETFEMSMAFGYLYQDARFRDDPVFAGNRIAGQPRHQLNIRLPLVIGDKWLVEPGVHARLGNTYADHANTLGYGGLIDTGLTIVYKRGDRWQSSLHLLNLLNRNQVASPAGVLDRAVMGADTSIFLPASPFQLRFQVEHNW